MALFSITSLSRPFRKSGIGRPKQRLVRYILGLIVLLLVLTALQPDTVTNIYHYRSRRRKIQHDFRRDHSTDLAQRDRLEAVEREFLHAWTGYKTYSWMGDSLLPLSASRHDQFCGWAATLVDSLDTLYIMGLTEQFEEAVTAVLTINFRKTDCDINIFESTIRYLGGLISAYDLSQDHRLLPKIKELSDVLFLAFQTENGMPCDVCRFNKNTTIQPSSDAPLANMATFYLEFGRLWQITGDMRYHSLVSFLTETFENAQMNSSQPGLWPERVDATSIWSPENLDANFVKESKVYSLGALSDSAYEYLVKAHLLLGGLTHQYAKMWSIASIQIRQYLLFRAHTPRAATEDLLFSGILHSSSTEARLEARIEHLSCFAGGMFAMSSRLFHKPEHLKIGAALTRGCIWAYDASPIGIMPETVTLVSCPLTSTPSSSSLSSSLLSFVSSFYPTTTISSLANQPQCHWNATFWNQTRKDYTQNFPPGYLDSIDVHYALRPEAVESIFVLWRVTGDPTWRDAGWRIFNNIIQHTRTEYGHASLTSVMQSGQQRDEMESFWLAETLKYFYLLFSDPALVSLDDFVLNTEAHPFRLERGSRG